MIRNFKVMGLVVVAVLAMSAVVASAASAAQFTASAYPATVTATSPLSNDDFKTEAGSVECAGHFQGSASGPSETLTVTPTYSSCQAFGFLEATVNMNGCDYVFHADGTVDVECPEGKKIVIVALSCEVQIGSQTGLSSVDLTNSGSNVNAKATVGGVAYTVTKDGFLCPFNGTGAKTGATYTQNNAIAVSRVGGGSVSVDP